MRLTALIITPILFFGVTTIAFAGDSSVNVRINNNVNSKSTTTYSSHTKTKIDIEQEGNGYSEVTVNGKEYKVEGPGELHVDEYISSTNPPTTSNTNTPKPTIERSPTPTPRETAEVEVLGVSTQSFSDVIEDKIEELRNYFERFFTDLFSKLK